jgi:hypothetical protein
MHSAIVVMNMPEKHESEGHHPKWVACLADLSRASEPMVRSLEDQEGVLRLAENVWQVSFHDNPVAFARLISCAMHHKLTYGILQLRTRQCGIRPPFIPSRDDLAANFARIELSRYDLSDAAFATLWLAGAIFTTSTQSVSEPRGSNSRSAATSAPDGLSEVKSSCL